MHTHLIRHIAGVLATSTLLAADVGWPTLDDPIGLGPRLTTIAWLRDHGVAIPAGASDGEIVVAYAKADPGFSGATSVVARSEEKENAERAEIARLRYLLHANHRIDAPAEADIGTLASLLLAAEAARRQAEFEDARQAAGRVSVIPPAEPGPAAAAPATAVPVRYQLAFADVAWKTLRGNGTVAWRRAEVGSELGGIWSRWVKWNDKSYQITSYTEESPEPKARFSLVTDVGSFQATRLTEHAWEIVYTDNAGLPLVFRTAAAEIVIPEVGGGHRSDAGGTEAHAGGAEASGQVR